jgi:hypothetical protein
MSLMHFHSNVSYCCVTMSCDISIVTKQCERRRYYGYGSVIDKREFSSEVVSCIRGLVEFRRVLSSY